MYSDDMPPGLVQTMTMEKHPANWELDARTVGMRGDSRNSVKLMEIQPAARPHAYKSLLVAFPRILSG
jgi:hypothetical protein